MRAPLAIPALVFLAAIVAGRDFPPADDVVLATVAGSALVAARTRAHLVAALAVALGLALGVWRGNPPSVAVEVAGVRLAGTVAGEATARPWGETFELGADDGLRYEVASREVVALGERVVVHGRLEPFDEPRNPGEPSSRELARERGLAGILAQARLVERAPPDPYDLRTLPARVREGAGRRLRALLGEPDATILAGMLYGARGTLPPELRAEFADTGTVHVLVTAGLHLGVVAALAVFVFERFGFGRIGSSLLAIPLVWAYAIVSGGHVPSLRAATMATVAFGARALGERSLSLNALAAAAIVVGAIWPAWVGCVSFALSFSCVTAIALFAEPISRGLVRLPRVAREALALTLSTQ
ncbi:MAG: ComEC/Rec2 family competence protein, partial [Candidatus Eremiobacteraeota bacterium]|nr:ComEC/Rec2 family competence protein [Candidatus Eremiobacteraeota bacterium]